MAGSDIDAEPVDELERDHLDLSDRWILSRLNRTITGVDESFDAYRFNETAKKIYDFTWSDFCDWYVEIIKSRLYGEDDLRKQTAISVATYVLKSVVKMLHPFSPFITEELWQKFESVAPDLEEECDLIVASWPLSDSKWLDENAEKELSRLQSLITGVRTIRSEMGVPPSSKADVIIRTNDGEAEFIASNQIIISDLARVENLNHGSEIGRAHV